MTRLILGLLALWLSATCAAGQEPSVELPVRPEKSVFKSSVWSKPRVIKSRDEAAKHFGKEALEQIAKKVDFTKQIVLLFAWQGSSGDKLEYRVLESYPEQMPFSLRPGDTRDRHWHSRVFALRTNVKWSVIAPK